MIHMHAVPAYFPGEGAAHPPRMAYLTNSEVDESGKYRAIHSHADIVEIALVYEGQGMHTVGGQTYCSSPGDIILYNAGVLHQDLALDDRPMRFFCCGVSGVQEKGLPPGCLARECGPCLLPSGDDFPFLKSGFECLEKSLAGKRPAAAALAQGFLQALLAVVRDLDDAARKSVEQAPARQLSLAEEIRQYIDYNYASDFSLEELAQAFHVSRFHVSHVFAKAFDSSPIQYRTRRRIGEAQSLLTGSDYSITYIAGAVGYDDPNRFSQVFSKIVGMSPSRYRDLSVRS